jgi:hypothetical protein
MRRYKLKGSEVGDALRRVELEQLAAKAAPNPSLIAGEYANRRTAIRTVTVQTRLVTPEDQAELMEIRKKVRTAYQVAARTQQDDVTVRLKELLVDLDSRVR